MTALKICTQNLVPPTSPKSIGMALNRSSNPGGRIRKGFLVGVIHGSEFQFRYCQLEVDGTLNGGKSNCVLECINNLTRIVENFEWESKPGGGRNVIQQMEHQEE